MPLLLTLVVCAVFAAPLRAGVPTISLVHPTNPEVAATHTGERTTTVGISWFGFSLSAVSASATDPVTFEVQLTGTPTSAHIALEAGGSVSLSNGGGGLWSVQLSAAQVLYGYTSARVNHNFVGFLRVFEGVTQSLQFNVFINVADGSVPPVMRVRASSTFQYSCHVANVLRTGLTFPPAVSLEQSVVSEVLSTLGDEFDFINLVYTQPGFQANRNHRVVKNAVTGIGLGMFDTSASWGSEGKLLGVTQYPIDGLFDLAETASLHELAHQWINYSTMAFLSTGMYHWRPGTQARGIMGVSLAGGVGGSFPYELIPLGGGIYQMSTAPLLREYTDLDLYYMGFLAPEAVGTNFAFTDPNITMCHGCSGPVTFFDVGAVILAQGPRVPDASASPHRFRVGTVVVTRDRLLTGEELALFDYFAARGEATSPLPFTAGFESGVTKPFHVATGGLGTLETRVMASCDLSEVGEEVARDKVAFRVTGPNPAHGEMAFVWNQPVPARVTIDLFSVAGKRVARVTDAMFEFGLHTVTWTPEPIPSGIYYASLALDGRRTGVRQLVVVR